MPQSKSRAGLRRRAGWLLAAAVACLAAPATAAAHGPVDPAASRYEARIIQVPAGLQARVVDGDLRLWLRAAPGVTADVVDYRGATYLRFTSAGVYVNRNSAMYYVNQVPPVTPPISLGPRTAPSWERVSRGHTYEWQDGRLQALAKTVLPPGSNDAGRWSIAVVVNGRPEKIVGSLYHRPDPSPVWFWPIIVALLCVLAGLRLRRPELDRRMAVGLAGLALTGFAVASVGHQLHGRPVVSTGQLVVLGLELAFTAWGVVRLARGQPGWIALFVIAGGALWQGIALAPTLVDGYVLLATGSVLGRLAEIASLAGGAGLLPIVFVMAERGGRSGRSGRSRSGAGAPPAEAAASPRAWETTAQS